MVAVLAADLTVLVLRAAGDDAYYPVPGVEQLAVVAGLGTETPATSASRSAAAYYREVSGPENASRSELLYIGLKQVSTRFFVAVRSAWAVDVDELERAVAAVEREGKEGAVLGVRGGTGPGVRRPMGTHGGSLIRSSTRNCRSPT